MNEPLIERIPTKLMFSSGTTGKRKTVEIEERQLAQNAKEFIQAYGGNKGSVYNLFPQSPNIGYLLVNKYAELNGNCLICCGGFASQTIVGMSLGYPPTYIAGLGVHILQVLKEAKEKKVKFPQLKHVIVAKGILPYRKELEELLTELAPNAILHATYGLTELKRAWTTLSSLDDGYWIPEACFQEKNGLLWYDGKNTGDLGTVTEKNEKQFVGLAIERKEKPKTEYCGGQE